MQTLNLKLRGLYTHPNQLSEVPPGALLKAKNMILDKEGILETRRGFKKYGTQLTLSGSEKINKIFNYDEDLIVHYASKLAYDSNGSGTWTDYSGTYSAPTGSTGIKSLEAKQNIYFSTSTGIKKLDSLTGTITDSGGYKGLDGVATTTGGSGFLTNNNQVAYRVVWGYLDANTNLILGAPSQRIIVINTSGGSRDISLTFTVPSGITTSHFYQIYRSGLSGGAAIVPNDELGLVYEDNPTSGEISAKSITITDSTPDTLRGATLYTSPSQQGISQANDSPPLCIDMTFYKNNSIYANTTSKQRYNLTLLAVGGSSGVAVDDTITIGGIVYTGKGTETASSGQFKVYTSGTPAENIDNTAQSLVRVINQYASNTTYYAYYLSGQNDLPGKILLEERSIGGSAFVLIASNGGAFNPSLPTSGTTQSSSNERAQNRLYISKDLQPEAVPITNYIDVGSANKAIVRIISLRDSVFIFKEDGLYRMTGEDITTFTVSLFDVTVILNAPETAVPFNNQIFAYTSQGVVAISDTGTSIVSRPIEVDLLPVSSYTNFDSLSFGVAYNSDRKFILSIQTDSTDTYTTQQYIYNALSESWTRWEKDWNCAIVSNHDDKLYYGDADSGYIYQERKTYTNSDYADDDATSTITAKSGTTVNVSSTSGMQAGWTLIQAKRSSEIQAIVDSTTLTLADSLNWSNSSVTAYKPIDAEMETVAQSAGNPGMLKQFRDLIVFFRRVSFKKITVGVRSNLSPYLDNITVTPVSEGAWGSFAWGGYSWGSIVPTMQALRTYIPRFKQRCHWLQINVSHSVAQEYFAIGGISLQYSQMSERTK